MGEHGSMWEKWRESLTKTSGEHDADELREDTTRVGATPIDCVDDRQVVDVCGSVRAVTLPPKTSVPMLVVELYDGSRALNLVWLGRRRIAGIEPGRAIKVVGRVGVQNKMRVMFNPRYELK